MTTYQLQHKLLMGAMSQLVYSFSLFVSGASVLPLSVMTSSLSLQGKSIALFSMSISLLPLPSLVNISFQCFPMAYSFDMR